MRDALSFFKPGFAFMTVARDRLQSILSAFAIFNVREGSIPPNDPPMPISKGDTAHQKPSIFPISGATVARLVFEKLSGRNGDAPILGMAHKIFGMDRTQPTCPCTLLNRKPGVFGPSFIYKCTGAVRQRSESHRRNCFHNVPQTLFLMSEPMNPPAMKCPEQRNQSCDAKESKPIRLVIGRSDEEIEGRDSFVPHAAVIASLYPESVTAWWKIAVESLPSSSGILPIAIIAFQLVLEMYPLRNDKAQSRIVDLEITRKGGKTKAALRRI